MPNVIQTQPSLKVQEVSSPIQIQGKKLAGWEDTTQRQTIFKFKSE